MFYVFPTATDIADFVSDQLIQRINTQKRVVFGLATGSTMEPVYDLFIGKYQQTKPNLEHVYCFNLDEYVGLPAAHPQSYYAYMQRHLYQQVPFKAQQVFLPCGEKAVDEAHCQAFSALIKDKGGIDLQLLGIGSNGHIGFNEPGTSFDSRTHIVALSEQTRHDNSRFFKDKSQMPTHAVTLGLKDIMEAKEVYLLATGAHKAKIMGALQRSGVDEKLPASVLNEHPNTKILVDAQAAQELDQDLCHDYRTLGLKQKVEAEKTT